MGPGVPARVLAGIPGNPPLSSAGRPSVDTWALSRGRRRLEELQTPGPRQHRPTTCCGLDDRPTLPGWVGRAGAAAPAGRLDARAWAAARRVDVRPPPAAGRLDDGLAHWAALGERGGDGRPWQREPPLRTPRHDATLHACGPSVRGWGAPARLDAGWEARWDGARGREPAGGRQG